MIGYVKEFTNKLWELHHKFSELGFSHMLKDL